MFQYYFDKALEKVQRLRQESLKRQRTLFSMYSFNMPFRALQIIFVHKKQENNLRKALVGCESLRKIIYMFLPRVPFIGIRIYLK
ncbi:MAG: hypothetical protein VR65_08725 [Desulfobulbaceae bacterium BRH_c16a]|nr:MAG: hypothetical protein VR65_08725 [Desulfobulbaceae bacterium BRH_c16a]